MRIFFSFLIFITMAHAKVQNDSVISILPKLESLIQKTMQQKNIPGMAVAVVSKGKIVFIKGFGVRTLGRPEPINKKTLFLIGSTSKAITSTLIAILKQDQEISLDQPVELIPGATLRHVLSHTTGIPSPGFNALIERGGSPLEAAQMIKKVPIKENPGEKFSYHNVVYGLITKGVIERQTETSFESTLQTRLLHPLNMTQTSSTWEAFIAEENRVSAHVFDTIKGKTSKSVKGKMSKPVKLVVRKAPYRTDYTKNFPTAGGMSSNIHDMALFLQAVMGARPEVVSLQDLADFTTPGIHTPDHWHRTRNHRDRITKTRYGLGWRHLIFADQPLVFHGGWIRGACSMLAFLPEQEVGIVVLQNAESAIPSPVSMQFFDWVLGLSSKKWIE